MCLRILKILILVWLVKLTLPPLSIAEICNNLSGGHSICREKSSPLAPTHCPDGTTEISRERINKQTVVLYCQCNDLLLIYYDGQCRPEADAKYDNDIYLTLTGGAFKVGDRLRLHAKANFTKWDPNALNQFWLATLEAGQGSYLRAKRLLATARRKIRTDKVAQAFDELLDNLEQKYIAATESHGVLAKPIPTPSDLAIWDKNFYFPLIEASLHYHWGEYDQAIMGYQDVLDELLIEFSQDENDQARREVMKALAMARRSRATFKAYGLSGHITSPASRRDDRAALAGLNLAWQLAQLGEGKAAIPMLHEAQRYFQETDLVEDSLTPKLIGFRIAQLRRDSQLYWVGYLGQDYYYYGSGGVDTTNLLLDVVEYGNGDWDRSIGFAELLFRTWPNKGTEKVVHRLRAFKAMALSVKKR